MLFVGSFLILSALLFGLLRTHILRQKAWDRPAFSRSRSYAFAGKYAVWLLLLSGLVLLQRASLAALLIASASLATLCVWLRHVRSPRHAAGRLRRDRARLRPGFPGASEADLTVRVLRRWHPEWPEEIAARIVADHATLEDVARMVVRMESGF